MTTQPHREIIVSTLQTPPIPDKPYRVMGYVFTKFYDASTDCDVFEELQKEAYETVGDEADAIIGVAFETTGYVRTYETMRDHREYPVFRGYQEGDCSEYRDKGKHKHFFSHTYSRAYGTIIKYIEE